MSPASSSHGATACLRGALRRPSLRCRGAFGRTDLGQGLSFNPSSRQLHSLPPLPPNLSSVTGCEPLFSATTVRLLWDSWHAGLLEKLNDEVRGTVWENSSIVETVIGTAQEPELIQAFNMASLALNNSFFLSGLMPKDLPDGVSNFSEIPPPPPTSPILAKLEENFESLVGFKQAFSSAAYGMTSSGYVWLVVDRHGRMGIVPTFGAGTVLVQNRLQRAGASPEFTRPSVVTDGARPGPPNAQFGGPGLSPTSMPPPSSPSSDSSASPTPISPGGIRSFSTSAATRAVSGSRARAGIAGEELFPLLCVSVHERDWLPDYGMWGKEEYLIRFWECVNWSRIQNLHDQVNIAPRQNQFGTRFSNSFL